MHNQAMRKLEKLRNFIQKNVPVTATPEEVPACLGWTDEDSEMYSKLKQYGIDWRLKAPMFADLVSVVVDGHYMPKGHDLTSILEGTDSEFVGTCPQARILSVLDSLLFARLDA